MFSCQEGVLLRIGRPLTVQQLITTKQNTGQCVASVNKEWRRQKAQREYEVRGGGLQSVVHLVFLAVQLELFHSRRWM